MSLIEQAANRLEQLRKAGVELPEEPQVTLSSSGSATANRRFGWKLPP